MKPYLLRVHRWLTLIFAIPLAIIIVTGLMLSFEPIAYDRSFTGKSVSAATVEQALAKHDPDKKANTLSMRAYEGVMVLSEGRGPGSTSKKIDLATGELVPPSRGLWSDTMTTARRLHETLLLDAKWLVDASTIAMLVSMIFGLFMGLPFFRNSLGGWHRVISWGLSPLLFLSLLTAIAMAFGWFSASPPRVEGPPVALADATKMVAAKYDLADVQWIRPIRGAMLARVYDNGQAKVFAVSRDGLVAGPQSWPRAIHEGNFAGKWSGLMNVIISLAFIALMSTGLLIWAKRKFRKRNPRRARQASAQAA